MKNCDCNQGRLPCTCKGEPPAGDVEVPMRSNVQRYHAAEVIGSNRPGFWVHAGDYNADLSRLTAERDGLLAEVKRLDLKVSEYDYTFDSQQAELTKARELLMRLRNCKWIPTAEWQHEVSEVLAHQSAPAAKGEL